MRNYSLAQKFDILGTYLYNHKLTSTELEEIVGSKNFDDLDTHAYNIKINNHKISNDFATALNLKQCLCSSPNPIEISFNTMYVLFRASYSNETFCFALKPQIAKHIFALKIDIFFETFVSITLGRTILNAEEQFYNRLDEALQRQQVATSRG